MNVHQLLTYFIATVWLVNGLFCKVLNLVPRHKEIVGQILGDGVSGIFITAIGLAEVGMAVWVISGIKSRLNAIAQISIVATMNVLEFILVPDLLLWGKFNSLFAFIFILLVYYWEFVLNKKSAPLA